MPTLTPGRGKKTAGRWTGLQVSLEGVTYSDFVVGLATRCTLCMLSNPI